MVMMKMKHHGLGSTPDVAIVLCAEVEPKLGLPGAEVEATRQRNPEAGLPPGLEGQGCTDTPCAYPALDQGVLVCLQSCFARFTNFTGGPQSAKAPETCCCNCLQLQL